ncbi:hypothetical protein SNK05_013583 [Fusarium graminearum]
MFDHLAKRIQQNIGDGVEEVNESSLASSPVIEEAEHEYADAQHKFNVAFKNHSKTNDETVYLRGDRRLSDATEEMIHLIQLWKSAVKLDKSINEAREIFSTKLYPKRGASYICHSLMGDWYANAEFCIVHLDTDSRVDDAIRDWRLFKGEVGVDRPGITSFGAIQDNSPEWASRAWTLQELVMSKMAFFTNSEWKSLSRPVESLGYIYPLIPFIDIYTAGDIANTFSECSTAKVRANLKKAIVDSDALESLLDKSPIIVADDCQDQNASANVEGALRLVFILQALGFVFPAEMTTETAIPEMSRSVYLAAWNLVKNGQDESNTREREVLRELKVHIDPDIQSLSLTAEAEAQQILNLLLFGLLKQQRILLSLIEIRSQSSAKCNSLSLGSKESHVVGSPPRKYCNCPANEKQQCLLITFILSWEYLEVCQALSRLLDEVVVSHNDVSVFNWSGVGMGSPVRGRSMYPAFHEAYGNEKDHAQRYNMMISSDVQRKRKEVMTAYNGVINLLRDTIDFIKSKGREGLPLEWIQEICAFVRNSTFEVLRPELNNVGKILHYIQVYCSGSATVQATLEMEGSIKPSPALASDQKATFGRSFMKPSLPTMKLEPSLKAPKLPSFSFGGITASETQKPTTAEGPEWLSLDTQVKEYLKSLSSPVRDVETQCHLPSQIQQLDFKALEPEGVTESQGTRASGLHVDDDLSCPNPIIINSSGIEGIFDIQRIVVTMIDREKLSRQVARATSPKQKVSGWCIISTGFASVVVNFACHQHILKKQLDIEEAVQDKVIKEDRASKLHSNLEIKVAAQSKAKNGSSTQGGRPSEAPKENEKDVTTSWKATKEEQAIVRIIDFIQEPTLQLVAGEWVLARFSGAQGQMPPRTWLNPFILWSSYRSERNRLYQLGHRAWTYECLEDLHESKEKKDVQRLGQVSEQFGRSRQGYEYGVCFYKSSLKLPLHENGTKDANAEEDLDSENDKENVIGLFEDLFEQGKEAATALGEYTVLAAYERICEMQAKHLDKHLSTSVLKRTPKSLQTAVESVDENKGFLPAMFHSSRQVHMF